MIWGRKIPAMLHIKTRCSYGNNYPYCIVHNLGSDKMYNYKKKRQKLVKHRLRIWGLAHNFFVGFYSTKLLTPKSPIFSIEVCPSCLSKLNVSMLNMLLFHLSWRKKFKKSWIWSCKCHSHPMTCLTWLFYLTVNLFSNIFSLRVMSVSLWAIFKSLTSNFRNL